MASRLPRGCWRSDKPDLDGLLGDLHIRRLLSLLQLHRRQDPLPVRTHPAGDGFDRVGVPGPPPGRVGS
jgi:hypothetical protein